MSRIARPSPPDGCVLRVHTWPARQAVRVEIAARPGALPFHTHRRYLEPWNETHCPDDAHRLERAGYVFDHDGQPVDLSVCSVCPHAELTPGDPA